MRAAGGVVELFLFPERLSIDTRMGLFAFLETV